MHLGGLLSTQDSYASFVLSNLPRASITPWLHAARLPFLNWNWPAVSEAIPGRPGYIIYYKLDKYKEIRRYVSIILFYLNTRKILD